MSQPSHNPNDWHLQAVFASLVPISMGAIQWSIYLNAGGLFALVTFLGTKWGDCRTPSCTPPGPPDLTSSFVIFGLGVLAGGAAFICSYVTQLTLYAEEVNVRDGKPREDGMSVGHMTWVRRGACAYLLALALFAVGAFLTGLGLS